MKSLEIVNLRVERLNNKPEMELVEKDEMVMISNNDMGYAGILTLTQLETIKQDLEVLEIIRKKDVNIKLLESYIKEELENDEDILECYNSHLETYRQLTLEELIKIRKWLEENENE